MSPETRVPAEDLHRRQYVSIFISFHAIIYRFARFQPAKPVRKQNLTPNSPSTSFKVRVLDRLKQVDVRTSNRKKFGVQATFARCMLYFTIIRPIITVHNIVHIIVPSPVSKNLISKHMQTTQYSLQTRKSTPYSEIVYDFLYC